MALQSPFQLFQPRIMVAKIQNSGFAPAEPGIGFFVTRKKCEDSWKEVFGAKPQQMATGDSSIEKSWCCSVFFSRSYVSRFAGIFRLEYLAEKSKFFTSQGKPKRIDRL
jgi:hypothetical protein